VIFIGQGGQVIAHAKGPDHPVGQFGGLLDIVGGPGADPFENQFFSHPAAKGNGQFAFKLVLIFEIPFLGQKPGHPGGSSPGNDGDFINRIRIGKESGHKGVSAFMIGRGFLFFFLDDLGFSFKTHIDLVFGIFKILHGKFLLTPLGCEKGCLIDQVFQIRAGKSGRSLCQQHGVNIRGQGSFFHVNP